MQAERLDDEIMCKPCGKKCPTTKALAIWRLPKILVCFYHLVRKKILVNRLSEKIYYSDTNIFPQLENKQ